ncbi:hypothetical protein [Streptomyces shenzhenensis]|uniref:Uncharacterized protein n=1 Tax=Streptomyces shenzhenensis TaxID=943815 RepID=A0A3M0IA67_9ACTN|nr:hypothetical protein [Streptomyces shenzhenensis]RMB85977.1 hypothetical protein CTZ28_10760 [Streptomyces shenzhenensis]
MALPTVVITDPLPGYRINEPLTFTVDAALEGDLWTARTDTGDEVLCQRLTVPAAPEHTTFVAVVSFEQRAELTLTAPVESAHGGIRRREPREQDAFVRLDTGYFDLEMCTGTARGTGASKWGLRHFGALAEGVDLLPSGDNAIGGFYGPFFTPENGLINPPEHTTVDIEVIEQGPVLHHYRMHGTVPDGLLHELRGKKFSIDWKFTYGTPFFTRTYRVDDFRTVINGRSVINKITVGDEFESGTGDVVFTRFEAYDGTRYRAGDPYAEELKSAVGRLLASQTSPTKKFEAFKSLLTDGLETAHWDLYWRLFSTWEDALPDADIRECLDEVMTASHVRADLNDRPWMFARDGVDVSAAPDETVFVGPATKTVEYHPRHGRAMIWWTSQAPGAFQIVQRRQSGWVNWGTNGENECPELPVGVEIKTAYGPFAETWTTVADRLETPPRVTFS